MFKKALSVMLVFILIFSAVPLVSARPADEGWLVYCARVDKKALTVSILAPANYTRVADDPQIETVCTTGNVERTVSTPVSEQIPFYFNGKTETRWMMTTSCTLPEDSVNGYTLAFALLPGSVLDDAGNGNALVLFDDELDHLSAEGYVDIDVYSGLLQSDYSRDDVTAAVGDTLRVCYSGLYPVEIVVNGETAASLPGGEMQEYTVKITETGSLRVVVRQAGGREVTRSLTVITSREMYRRNLRETFIIENYIPRVEDLIQVGVPAHSLFIPIIMAAAVLNEIRVFFVRLFSFVRITK